MILRKRASIASNPGDCVIALALSAFRCFTHSSGFWPVTSSSHRYGSSVAVLAAVVLAVAPAPAARSGVAKFRDAAMEAASSSSESTNRVFMGPPGGLRDGESSIGPQL